MLLRQLFQPEMTFSSLIIGIWAAAGLSAQEYKKANFKRAGEEYEEGKFVPEGKFFWQEFTANIEFNDVEKSIIAQALKSLSDSKKLKEEYISIYEKFVIGSE